MQKRMPFALTVAPDYRAVRKLDDEARIEYRRFVAESLFPLVP